MFKVVKREEMAEGTVILNEIEVPRIARKAKPGQFVILKAKEEDLIEIPDIGPKVASSIMRSFKNKEFQSEIKNLKKHIHLRKTKASGEDGFKLTGVGQVCNGVSFHFL